MRVFLRITFLVEGKRLFFQRCCRPEGLTFNLSLTDPRIFDTEILAGIDAFNRKTNYYSYKSRNTGGGLRFGKSITEYDWVGINYRFDDITISDVQSIFETSF